MPDGLPKLNCPEALPVVARRGEIVQAINDHQVVVVVSETGSGKRTQLPAQDGGGSFGGQERAPTFDRLPHPASPNCRLVSQSRKASYDSYN